MLMLLVASPVVIAATQSVDGEAAAKKTGTEKSKRQVLRLRKRKESLQQWRTIKVGKRRYRFYFDKKGRAYQADRAMWATTGVVVKKIKGRYYGFDYQGHMVKGIRCGITSEDVCRNLYFFNSNGVFNRQEKNCIQKCTKNNSNASSDQETYLANTKKYLPVKMLLVWKRLDVTYVYDSLALSVFRPTGKEQVPKL